MFYLLLRDMQDRDAFIAHMRSHDVDAPFHYIPLHSASAGRKLARAHGTLSVTEDISARLVRLPMYFDLGTDIERVIEVAQDYLTRPQAG